MILSYEENMCNVHRLPNCIGKLNVLCIITIILSTEAKKELTDYNEYIVTVLITTLATCKSIWYAKQYTYYRRYIINDENQRYGHNLQRR